MTAVWPASLPQAPRPDGYAEAPRSNVYSFQPTVGKPIRRRRSTLRIREISMSFQMTGEQVDTFERFFQEEIADGVKSFQWVDPRTGSDKTWMFDIPSDQPPYQISPSGGRAHNLWDVSFKLIQTK